MSFRPYLFFGGDCRAAMTRYQEIFGGELQVMTAGDAPQDPAAGPPMGDPESVLHAGLVVGEWMLMASDDPTGGHHGVHGMMVSHTAADVDEARRIFDALAEGGQVTQPLVETFFAPAFGMCTDRFGTPWMVDVMPEQPPAA